MQSYGFVNYAIRLTGLCLGFCIVSPMGAFAQDDFGREQTKAAGHQPPEHDWPGFLGPNRDGRSRETGIITDWSNGRLKILWRRKLGTGYSLGSTDSGKYYQLDAQGNECRLVCLNERTGREIWDFSYEFEYKDMYGFDNGPRTSPLISDGRVYILGVEGMLHCLDANDGKPLWKVNTTERFGVIQNFFGVGSTPIVSGDRLLVMIGGSPASDKAKGNRLDEVSPNNTGIVIFDKRTGKVLHELINDLASYSSINFYQDNSEIRGVAWMRENVVGFDIENGKQLWKFPYRARKYESVNASSPVVRGTQILLSESYGPGSILLNVRNNTPRVIWRDKNIRQRSLATHWNTPVFDNGFVYACDGESRSNCDIRCVEWSTGEVKWKRSGYSRSSLTYVDGHFVVLDETGKLFLIKANPKKFELVTTYSDSDGRELPLIYPCWAAPVISNGLLFVRGKNELICLAIK